jgi:hypothetical protein
MPKRFRLPSTQIIAYKQLKTAAGGSGSAGGGGGMTAYRQGQNVACKINYPGKDGYAVTIQKDNLPGFIKTGNVHNPGDEILGVFVCAHNGRILLSQLFSDPNATQHHLQQTTVKWEEYLTKEFLINPSEATNPIEKKWQKQKNLTRMH